VSGKEEEKGREGERKKKGGRESEGEQGERETFPERDTKHQSLKPLRLPTRTCNVYGKGIYNTR
jgi:hypothetical protein